MERILLYVCMISVFLGIVHTQDPTVQIAPGTVIGKTTTVPIDELPYQNVHEFLGIPFAEPPVGEKRFLKPEYKWDLGPEPLIAQKHGAICPQTAYFEVSQTAEQNEDCLFLNLYVPDQPPDEPTGHAVMIWIYGGGFQEGASNYYNGAVLAAVGNVIVVTFNYRVGAFGFLSTGDENAPGNIGLWDQHCAFEWVISNIREFGGDTQRITIAGESAGAISAMHQAMFPANQRRFQRVIAQSGSASLPIFDMERDVMKEALVLASQLGCPTSMDELMYCLRQKSADEILTGVTNLQGAVNFGPVVDRTLIKENPQEIVKMSGYRDIEEVEFFRSLDILTGFNAYEGAFMLPYIMDPSQVENIRPTRDEMRYMYLPTLLKVTYRKEYRDELTKIAEAQYTNWTNPDDYRSIRLQITKMAGDLNFAVPAVEMSRLHRMSSAARNFMYHFTPEPSVRAVPTPSWIPGANHADEILFMFAGIGVIGVGEENAWEIELLTKIVTYWTNFIKSGDPNSPEKVTPYWPEYNIDTGDYIELEKAMSDASVKKNLIAEEANFWLKVFPDLAEAMQGGGDGGLCGEYTNAATDVNTSRTVAVVFAMMLSYVYIF